MCSGGRMCNARSRNKMLCTLLVILLASIGWLCGSAEATAGGLLSIPELTSRAEVIVIGGVVASQSEWDQSRRVIVTQVQLKVEEALKGAVSETGLSFFQLGGKVGDMVLAVPDTPIFRPGERTLLFLARKREGSLEVIGLFQGKFCIERDPASSLDMAIRRAPGSDRILDQVPLELARSQILTALGR